MSLVYKNGEEPIAQTKHLLQIHCEEQLLLPSREHCSDIHVCTGVKKVVIRECNEGGPHHQVGGSQSGQPRSTVPTVMYLISLAHLVEEGLDEQGWWSAFSSIKLTHPQLVNTLPLTTTITNPIRDSVNYTLVPTFHHCMSLSLF